MAAPIGYDSVRPLFFRPWMELADHAVIGNANGKFRNRDQRCAFWGKCAHGGKPSTIESCCPGCHCIGVYTRQLAESRSSIGDKWVSEFPTNPMKDSAIGLP